MYKDFKKFLKGQLHIIIICWRSSKIRELSKLLKNYINKKQLMAKLKAKKVLINGKRRSFFYWCGQIIKNNRTWKSKSVFFF